MNTQYGVNTLDSAYSANNSNSPNARAGSSVNPKNVFSNIARTAPIDKTVLIILLVVIGVIVFLHASLTVTGDIAGSI